MNRFDFDALYDSLPSDGWLTWNEADLLYRTAEATKGPILEVGCYQGRSTCLLAALKRPVYTVDPFDGFHSELTGDQIYAKLFANLGTRNLSNVTVFRYRIEDWLDSQDFKTLNPSPIGFGYLDGDHTFQGTLTQIDTALLLGIRTLAIHDVNDNGGGLEVKKAALNRLGAWDERVERLAVWNLDNRSRNVA